MKVALQYFDLGCNLSILHQYNSAKDLEVLARLELAAFCVLSRRDNHYTTEPSDTLPLI